MPLWGILKKIIYEVVVENGHLYFSAKSNPAVHCFYPAILGENKIAHN